MIIYIMIIYNTYIVKSIIQNTYMLYIKNRDKIHNIISKQSISLKIIYIFSFSVHLFFQSSCNKLYKMFTKYENIISYIENLIKILKNTDLKHKQFLNNYGKLYNTRWLTP